MQLSSSSLVISRSSPETGDRFAFKPPIGLSNKEIGRAVIFRPSEDVFRCGFSHFPVASDCTPQRKRYFLFLILL